MQKRNCYDAPEGVKKNWLGFTLNHLFLHDYRNARRKVLMEQFNCQSTGLNKCHICQIFKEITSDQI